MPAAPSEQTEKGAFFFPSVPISLIWQHAGWRVIGEKIDTAAARGDGQALDRSGRWRPASSEDEEEEEEEEEEGEEKEEEERARKKKGAIPVRLIATTHGRGLAHAFA